MTQAPFCLFGLALFSKNLNHRLLCSNLLFIDGLLLARLLFARQLDFVWQKLKIYLKVNSNMPAVATTSDDDIVLVLKEHPEIFENNQLIKEKNEKWKPIKQKLPNISLHNLYIRIQQNRSCNKRNAQGIQDRLKNIFSYHSEISSFWPTKGITKTVQDTCKSNENNEEIIKEQIPNQSYTYVDEFDTIHKMKYDVNYSNIINSISCNKLEIIYFSKEQLDLLKDVINCELPISVIVLSNIIDKTKMRSHISEPVSYLSLSCGMENQVISLAQGLSESIDQLFVYNFILRILKTRIPLPSNLTIIYDQRIMDGICTAVNQCTFEEYISKCYNNIEVPVNLHIDIVSLLIAISNLEHFHLKPKLVKNFYIKCVIQLSLCLNREDFDSMVKDIFIVMFSSVEMINTPRLVLENQFNNSKLKDKFNRFQSYEKEENCAYIFTNKIEVNVKTSNETEFHIEKIKSSSIDYIDSSMKTTKPNAYYLPGLYPEFKLFLSYFPSWINMKDETNDFDLASSSTSLTLHQFNDLNSIPFRASNFLHYHINDIKRLTQKGRTFMATYKGNHKEINVYEKHYCLSFEENWMGKNNCNVELTYKEETSDHEVSEVVSEDQSLVHIQDKTSNSVAKDLFSLKQFLPKSTKQSTKSVVVQKPQLEPKSTEYLQNNCNEKVINEKDAFDHQMELDNSETQLVHIQDKTSNSVGKDLFSLKQFLPKSTKQSTKSVVVQKQQLEPKSTEYLQNNCNEKVINEKDALDHEMELDNSETQLVHIQDKTSNSVGEDLFSLKQFLPISTQPSTNIKSQVKPKRSEIGVDHSEIQLSAHNQNLTTSDTVKEDFSKKQQLLHKYTQPSKVTSKLKKSPVKPNKSRKYLDACPGRKIIHQQTSTSTRNKSLREQLIQNESPNGVRMINRKLYVLENSSAIDSIMEVVKFSFLNYNDFKTSKDLKCSKICNNVCLVKCLLHCLTSGRFVKFYNTRAQVMLKIGSSQGDRISINEKVGSIFEKLMKLHYSHEVTGLCLMCKEVFCCDEPILVFSETDKFTIVNLEKLVQSKFSNLHIKCDYCSDDCMVSYKFGAYLAIDIEILKLSMKIDEIPNQIVLLNSNQESNTFVLSGVIGTDEEALNDNVSYCRRVNNFWDKRSNTAKTIAKLKKLPLVSLKILFYVKITEL